MPAFITHHLFGHQLLQYLEKDASAAPDFHPEKDASAAQSATTAAFLLGNQGPDPFFFALRTPRLVALKKLGSALHNKLIGETLDVIRDYCARAPQSERRVLRAYLGGYLCHYSLDSVAHPFIYAQQYAFCAAGVAGLDERDGSEVHGQIEADLDAMILYRQRGLTIGEICPTREILRVDAQTLAILDALYCAVAEEVFGEKLALGAFSRCVADMRLTLRAFYSPQGIKRDILGRLERLARRHSLVQAMSTRVINSGSCDFDNHQRQPWQNPFTGTTSTEDFLQLFARAEQQAARRLQALESDAPTSELWNGLNFEGAAI